MLERGDLVLHRALGPAVVLGAPTVDTVVVQLQDGRRAWVRDHALRRIQTARRPARARSARDAKRDVTFAVLRDPPSVGARGWFRTGGDHFRGVIESVKGPYVIVVSEDGQRFHIPKRSLRVEYERVAGPAPERALPPRAPKRAPKPRTRPTAAPPPPPRPPAPVTRTRTRQTAETRRRETPPGPIERVRAAVSASHPDLHEPPGRPTAQWTKLEIRDLAGQVKSEEELVRELARRRLELLRRMEARLASPPVPVEPLEPRRSATQQLREEVAASTVTGLGDDVDRVIREQRMRALRTPLGPEENALLARLERASLRGGNVAVLGDGWFDPGTDLARRALESLERKGLAERSPAGPAWRVPGIGRVRRGAWGPSRTGPFSESEAEGVIETTPRRRRSQKPRMPGARTRSTSLPLPPVHGRASRPHEAPRGAEEIEERAAMESIRASLSPAERRAFDRIAPPRERAKKAHQRSSRRSP